jgi:glycosyltransferase involved in cell wall biosynthesis
MQIAFVHQYFPGQFVGLARHLVDQGHEVTAFHRGIHDGRSSPPVSGVREVLFGEQVPPTREGVLGATVTSIIEAAAMAEAADRLRQSGWRPDVVYSHTSWGSAAFLHDVFPRAKFIKYCEWYFNNSAASTEYLNPGGRPLAQRMATEALNLPVLADVARGHVLISPTNWQKAQFPLAIRDRIEVVPDGTNLGFFAPDPDAQIVLPNGRTVDRRDRIVTYVARGADPFRGFGQFLKALAILQAQDQTVEAIILGDRTVYYGRGTGTENHFQEALSGSAIDPARTHFLGTLPYEEYRRVLQISSVHVYLTVPFVLSWSCLEAMAVGCAIVGSDTAPVREFVEHGENGLLANFFDPADIADQVRSILMGEANEGAMRAAARRTIETRWSSESAIAAHMAILDGLVGNR